MEMLDIRIDWRKLRAQKCTLINEIGIAEKEGKVLTTEHLTGILHLIDSIQDDAAERIGTGRVFGH
jgi:hypothetical protein